MSKSTLRNTFLATVASFGLICFSTPTFAQHGGGHGGGGGGGLHGGGSSGGGGFHSSGSSGGFHGGSYGGGSYGGSMGSERMGASSARGSFGSSGASRAWSSESRSSVRDTSPGWHSFQSGNSIAGHSNAANGERSTGDRSAGERSTSERSATASRSGTSNEGLRSGETASHSAIADGNWHPFNASHSAGEPTARSNTESRTTLASNLRTTSVGHADLAAGNHALGGVGSRTLSGSLASRNLAIRNSVFANGPLRSEFLFNRGFGFNGRGPLAFGCCGWGFGWGLGFGWGWGFGWSPFWDWYPYWYNPWWYYPYAYPY